MKITRPVLRYPGGKYQIAKWVISHFPAHETYVEPYCGADSVLMRKSRSQGEVINDLDGDVVNVFRVLRNPTQAAELEKLLRLTPLAYEEYQDAWDLCEEQVENARRTIFRSFASIGSDGVNRKNSGFRGLKNKSSGVTAGLEWSRYPDAIRAFLERLQGVTIEHRDALHVIGLYDRPKTLFYVDPPYMMNTRSTSSVRYLHEMTNDDHIELAKLLHQVEGMVVLSGYQSQLYEQLYSGWKISRKASKAQNGKRRVECLWLSPNIKTTLF